MTNIYTAACLRRKICQISMPSEMCFRAWTLIIPAGPPMVVHLDEQIPQAIPHSVESLVLCHERGHVLEHHSALSTLHHKQKHSRHNCTISYIFNPTTRDANESRSRRVSKKISQREISRPKILSSYFYVTKSKAFTHSRAAQRQAL